MTSSRLPAKWVLLTCLILPLHVYAQSFQEGKEAYLAKDYSKAFDILMPLANQGDPKAQMTIAMMYDYGQGVPKDSVKAVEWYTKAAAQGVPIVQHDLGVKFFRGIGVPRDYTAAARWWRMAGENGLVESQYNLGLMHYKGMGVEKDYGEALKWFKMAAEQNHALSQYNLGLMYAFGQGVNTDYREACRWFLKAAENGVPQAQYNLGVLLENGLGAPRDREAAKKWYQLAAKQGVTQANKKLAALEKGAPASPPRLTSPAGSQSIQREAWIKAQDPSHFTIQLVTARNEQAIVDLLNRHNQTSNRAYFRRKLNGAFHYTAILGVFKSSQMAAEALAALPPDLKRSKPLIRQFAVLQELILLRQGILQMSLPHASNLSWNCLRP